MTRTRTRRAIAIACAFHLVCAGSLLVAQNPPPPAPPAPPVPVPAPAPAPAPEKADEKKPEPAPAPVIDDVGNAAKVTQQYEKLLVDKDVTVRLEALKAFQSHRNESYVKLLAPQLKEKNEKVAMAAVAALGNQPFQASIDALLNYACDDKKGAPSEELRRAAIKALGDAGIGKRGYDRLRATFDMVDDDGKLAIFETLVKVKEKRAFSLMVDHMDQPSFSGANRPPESVQKTAFNTWNKCKGTVRKGLRDLTGEGFPTAKQYVEWASGPAGRKAGFTYERGK
jgi:hypothetical protein